MEQAELEQIIEQARLDRVHTLNLRDCKLSILPESIGNLSELKKLYLYNNELTTLPESIGNLSSLTNLHVGCNKLATLPDSINNLKNLNSLFLSDNQLTSLPANVAGFSNLGRLYLRDNRLTSLSEGIGNLCNLTELYLQKNKLISLSNSMIDLCNLREVYLDDNPWLDLSILQKIPNLKRVYCFGTLLPDRYWTHSERWKSEWLINEDNDSIRHTLIKYIGCEKILDKLTLFTPNAYRQEKDLASRKFKLDLSASKLDELPISIGKLAYLTDLDLSHNQLHRLPESIVNLSNLNTLNLTNNQLTSLPHRIANLSSLTCLYLSENPWLDLSSLQSIPDLDSVYCFGAELPRRYWTKFSDWEPKWLLEEDNAEIRRVLVQQIGYERICQELDAIELDTWREYTLLKIDGVEKVYGDEDDEPIDTEPMVLLKMTCPSTAHIHILRVPPEMMSAETAITWVNHGIHPDEFAVQT